MCPEIVDKFRADSGLICHPHPHNFIVQLLAEGGYLGLITGVIFLLCIVATCCWAAFKYRNSIFTASLWITPIAFFWPIATAGDFYGQWNNLFMWSALAISLAAATNAEHLSKNPFIWRGAIAEFSIIILLICVIVVWLSDDDHQLFLNAMYSCVQDYGVWFPGLVRFSIKKL